MVKRLLAICTALIFLLAASIPACAHAVPDLTRKGSISVTMRVGDTVVPGGSLTLYRVGEIAEDDGNYTFKTVDTFAGFTGSLEEVQSPELAQTLAGYAVDKQPLNIGLIDANGQVTFEALEPGLYLFVQNETAEGYLPAEPFLVSLPLLEDGAYVYDVDASPKVEIETASTATPTPKPATPDTKLPQTGQLNWPVPLLVISGLLLLMTGWMLRFGRKTGGYEK